MGASLFLNGNKIDLYDKPITRKLQVNDIAEIEKIKSSFSYTINIPATSKNVQILDMLGVIGNTSRKPYEAVTVDYVEDNLYLVRNGFALIRSKGNDFQINIIDGFKNIFDILGDSKINDLDFSSYNHNITLSTYINSLSNTGGYIYAIGDFGQGLNTISSTLKINAETITNSHAFPIVLSSQPFGAGGRSVVDTSGTSSIDNSFFVVQEDSLNINISNAGLRINGTFLTNSGSVNLIIKQYRGSTLQSSVVIANRTGNTGDTFTIDTTIDQDFSSVAEGDFFILGIESISASRFFESEVSQSNNLIVSSFNYFKIETQAPSFYLHTLLQMIFDQNDIEIETDLFSNAEFLKELITISNGYTVTTINQSINFSGLFDDITQISILKDIAFRYGLVLMLKNDKLYLTEIDRIVTGEFGFEDWTNKVSEFTSENYVLSNYAQNNNLRYKYPDNSNESENGILSVVNENIELTKDLFTSIFQIADFSEILQTNNVYLIPINTVEDSIIENTTTPIKIFKVDTNSVSLTVKLLEDTSEQVITSAPFLSLNNVNLQYYVNNYYDNFNIVINHYKENSIKINLNVIDIYNLDFKKLIFLRQKGRYYYLNSIQFTNGKIATAKIVEIASEPIAVGGDFNSDFNNDFSIN